jgi:hypothetical protein
LEFIGWYSNCSWADPDCVQLSGFDFRIDGRATNAEENCRLSNGVVEFFRQERAIMAICMLSRFDETLLPTP